MTAPGSVPPPATLLSIMVEDIGCAPELMAVCAGFEDRRWRCNALAHELIVWTPDWVLTHSEQQHFSTANGIEAIGKALHRVYTSSKFRSRGEIGELLLHIVLRSFLHSEQVISRIFFKDAANDTVKGFDAVHVVERSAPPGGAEAFLELWLGESKFYSNVSDAIGEVLSELQAHLAAGYLRNEFIAIADKVDGTWRHAGAIRQLMGRESSLDSIFARVVMPVLLTYDSNVAAQHVSVTEEYRTALDEEVRAAWQSFRSRHDATTWPREVQIRLILMPLSTKQDLVAAFDQRLKAWQSTLTS